MTIGQDHEGTYIKAREDWRNDPERRRQAEEWLDRQIEGLRQAAALAQTAVENLPPRIWQDRMGLETMIQRATELQRRAARDLAEVLAAAEHSRTSSTYIGNMAAFGEPVA